MELMELLDITSRALAEFKSHRNSANVDALKKNCLLRLFESEEYWQIPLDSEQRCNIAFATVNGVLEKTKIDIHSGIWQQYLLRFRACVRMALHYELRSATEDQSSINVLVAGNEFKIPLSSDPESYPEGVWDLDTIFLIFEMLDDIIRVLELAVSFKKRKVYQMRGRNTDSSVDESIRQCRQGLTEKVSLISESFKSICLSWGFSFPVSAHTLLKSVRSISSEQDVAKNLHLFKTAYSGFEAIIAKLQPKMRADGVQRMVS